MNSKDKVYYEQIKTIPFDIVDQYYSYRAAKSRAAKPSETIDIWKLLNRKISVEDIKNDLINWRSNENN